MLRSKKHGAYSEKVPNEDLLDKFFPCKKVAKVQRISQSPEIDAFDALRPKPGHVLDYNISQTYAKFDVGEKKLSIRNTKATYVAHEKPPPPKKINYFHGAKPCSIFLNDKIARKREILQKQYQKDLKDIISFRKKKEKAEIQEIHKILQEMAGPEWYQELSPKQMQNVEKLGKCIDQDLLEDSIVYTKENIASLGLVLRPHPLHIKKALKNCCGRPVEFLLLLYQFINPKRTEYSINDRLLLSAVVHLTMEDTLRELHIRIPSPPPPPQAKAKQKPKKKAKKIKYKSPYLEPSRFKPKPPKHTGIYKNTTVQYPQSPYFNYILPMKYIQYFCKCVENIENIEGFDHTQVEIIEETKLAQEKYNSIGTEKYGDDYVAPTLLLPSFIKSCEACIEDSTVENIEEEEEDKQETFTCICDDDFKCEKGIQCQPCFEDQEPEECEIENISVNEPPDFLDPACIETAVIENNIEKIYENYKATLKYPEKCTCYIPNKLATPILGGAKLTTSGHIIPVIQGIRENKCTCIEKYEQKIQEFEELRKSTVAKVELKSQAHKYVIGGVVIKSEGPVFLLGGLKPDIPLNGPPEYSLEEQREMLKNFTFEEKEIVPEIAEEEKICEPLECECRKKVLDFLSKQCACEKCKILDRRRNPFFFKTGSVQTPCGLVPVIGGIYNLKCDCLKNYWEKVYKYEYNKIIKKAKKQLRSNAHVKYIINGVTITPDGPVYNIAGLKSAYDCRCDKLYLEELEKSTKRESNYVEDDYFVKLEAPKPFKVSKECRVCKNNFEKFVDEQCDCPKCRDQRNRMTATYVMSGMKQTESGNLVPIVGGVQQKTCGCLKNYKSKIHDYEYGLKGRDKRRELQKNKLIIGGVIQGTDSPDYVISGVRNAKQDDEYDSDDDENYEYILPEEKKVLEVCKCKEELERFFSKRCRCEKCINIDSKKNRVCVIENNSSIEENSFCKIENKPNKTCDCLKNYVDKLKQYEEYKKRINEMIKIKSQKDKYIISGVTNTKDGPVYIISGIRPPVKCKCSEFIQKQLENNRMMAIAPKVPGGRVSYQICGVKETKEGNVFILSNALPVKDCKCMNMFYKFEAAHSFCQDFYNKYLQQMSQYISEYLLELDRRKELFKEKKELEGIDKEIIINRQLIARCIQIMKENELDAMNNPIIETLPFDVQQKSVSTLFEEPSITPEENEETMDDENALEELKDLEQEEELEDQEEFKEKEEIEKQTIEKRKVSHDDNTKEKIVNEIEERQTPKVSINVAKTNHTETKTGQTYLKRFFLFEEFPKNRAEQRELLLKAIESLMNDGFPLANLPDSHKLPHFKLWLQLRSGKFWTQEDKAKYWRITKKYTQGSSARFYKNIRIKLPLTKEQIRNATWKDAKYYQSMIAETQNQYYRKLRQTIIDNCREFYPLTFSYEFYCPKFRHVFFSYAPAKEEEVTPYSIIKNHELVEKKTHFSCCK